MRKTLWMAAVLVMVMSVSANAAQGTGEEGIICLGCHQDKGMVHKFDNGETQSLYVEGRVLAGSAHSELSCSGCHSGYSTSGEHPRKQYRNRRSFTVAMAGRCRECHPFKKGIHQRMLESLKEVVCVDCHTAHGVKKIEERADSCMGCHKYKMQQTFRSGEAHGLVLDEASLKDSVHGKLRCADCHFGFSSKEHPERTFADRRDFTIVATESCRRCHFDKYSKTLESIHYNVLSKGDNRAPVCVDCHGAHGIKSGKHEKLLSARRCQQCHTEIYATYSGSVHGKALLSEHNRDVPVCADCHKAHEIVDPALADFRNNIPEMCGNCHANGDIMKKYGLSTSVLDSYLDDFHGVTLTYYKKQEKNGRRIAVCTDCHGIHDIMKTKGPNVAALKGNLRQRCQKCHTGASANFPDSWISHYEPDFRRAPLVFAVNMVYSVFIPFMIIGLVLQIVLHIWRYAVNR